MPQLPKRVAVLTVLLVACATLASADDQPQFAIRAGKVLTMAGPAIDDGVVLVNDGKIVAVGEWGKVQIPAGTTVKEYENAWLTPGLVELHCHIAAGMGYGDLNDSVHQVNPELRNLDTILPSNSLMRKGLQGGVTTALFIPGSGSNMSGFGTLVKFHGTKKEDYVLRFPGALKIAQAGNPERGSGDLGRGRMGMNLMIRQTLKEGQAYAKRWADHAAGKGPEPEVVHRLEYLRGLFENKYPILVHTQIMQVVHSTIRILHDEFKLRPIISHATFDAFLNAQYVAKKPLHLNPGPRQMYFDRRARTIYGVAERWYSGGVRNMSVCTDSPVLPQEDLFYQGTMGAYFGAPTPTMLKGLTIGAAKALFIADRIGSLEKGKDADMVVWGGDPLDPRSRVQLTIVNGRRAYDLRRDRGRY